MELINQIDETFKFEDKEIRIIGTYNEPLFVAKDICTILELSNITEALRNIPEKWKCSEILNTLTRGNQTMTMLKEPAVYQLVMRSTKPMAKKFQEVVCEDILPTLRKKGEYKIQSIIDKNKELEDKLKEETYIRKNLKVRYEHILEKRIDIETYAKGGLIYIIGYKELPLEKKIGFASDLNERIKGFQTEFPYEPVVQYTRYFSLPDPIKIEKIVHFTLKKFRKRNGREWFRTDNVFTLQTFIEQVDEVVSFFEMIDKRYEKKKDIKYEQLNEYLKKEKVDDDDTWEDFDKDDDETFHEKEEKEKSEEDIENESKEEDDENKEEDNESKEEDNENKESDEENAYNIEDEKEDEKEDDDENKESDEEDEYNVEDEKELDEEMKRNILKNDLKRCYKCENYMDKSNFAKSPKRKDGLDNRCKICKKESYNETKKDKKMTLEEKKCTQCNTIKDISEFFNRIGSIDGKVSECKICTMVMYEKRKEKYETADIVIPKNKKCHICEVTKTITEFDLKKDSPDGHKIWCKKCCSEYAKNKRLVPKVAPSFKNCNQCLKELSIDNFWNNKSNKDGKDNKCTTCHKAKRKASENK
jgi:prophage antirepressor-like protein